MRPLTALAGIPGPWHFDADLVETFFERRT
jgi:hypothetical protein